MKNLLSAILVCLSLCSCASARAPIHVSPLDIQDFDFFDTPDMPKTAMHFFQTDVTFPKSKEEYDVSVLANDFIPFKGYKGQGFIYIHCKNIASVSLHLNGRQIDTARVCRDGFGKIDLKDVAENGENFLYVSNIKPAAEVLRQGLNYFLNIKIPYPSIVQGQAEHVNKRAFQICDDLLQAQIENGFPSAQFAVVKNGIFLKNAAFGTVSRVDDFGYPADGQPPVTTETLFDLASNTKMYSVNFAMQRLVSEGKISLNDKVSSFFPDFKDTKKAKIKGKDIITVFYLLTHQAGFPAGANYYTNKKIRNKAKKELRSNKEITLGLILETNLVYAPGTNSIYSDISYMLLGFIVEKVTGQSLDKYVEENIYKPLQLRRICYKPLKHGFSKKNIAATEINGVKRTDEEFFKDEKYLPIHGTVHDAEAFFAMDGVSGHAGLFANAESLAVLAQVMLNGGGYKTTRLFDSPTVNLFASQAEPFFEAGLGWRRQGAEKRYAWAFSPLADSSAIGHSGWTGTITLIDFKENLIVIMLTNAKHTPSLQEAKYRGKFEGDFYLAKHYGVFMAFVYAGLKNYDDTVLDDMLIELLENRYALLSRSQYFGNKGFYKDLKAILAAVQKQASSSKTLKKFLKSKTGQVLKKGITALKV